jgi:hypothetical protein
MLACLGSGIGVPSQSNVNFLPEGGPPPTAPKPPHSDSSRPKENEDLPYTVELWNESRTAVEQVLAITANASIGYSAFYAAARDHFDRYITLRHKDTIVNRWNGPSH